MAGKITRTFKYFQVIIKDGQTGEVLKDTITTIEPKREKVAVAFIKEAKKTNFIIDIVESEELREMSLDTFIANSTVVAPKETTPSNPA